MRKLWLNVKLLQDWISVFPHLWMPKVRCLTAHVKEGLLWQTKCKRNRLEHQQNCLAGQSIRASFFSPAERLVSTDRDLPTNLAQSCKPAAVGMFAYSGSVNICFYRMGPYSAEDNFKQLFGQLQTCMYSKLQYTCARKVPLQRGKEPVENIQSWSHYWGKRRNK